MTSPSPIFTVSLGVLKGTFANSSENSSAPEHSDDSLSLDDVFELDSESGTFLLFFFFFFSASFACLVLVPLFFFFRTSTSSSDSSLELSGLGALVRNFTRSPDRVSIRMAKSIGAFELFFFGPSSTAWILDSSFLKLTEILIRCQNSSQHVSGILLRYRPFPLLSGSSPIAALFFRFRSFVAMTVC